MWVVVVVVCVVGVVVVVISDRRQVHVVVVGYAVKVVDVIGVVGGSVGDSVVVARWL